jgi:hypothetical protein
MVSNTADPGAGVPPDRRSRFRRATIRAARVTTALIYCACPLLSRPTTLLSFTFAAESTARNALLGAGLYPKLQPLIPELLLTGAKNEVVAAIFTPQLDVEEGEVRIIVAKGLYRRTSFQRTAGIQATAASPL